MYRHSVTCIGDGYSSTTAITVSIPGLMDEVLGGWLVYSKELWVLEKKKKKMKEKKKRSSVRR